jgi:predicted nucleotidyltransferase
MPMHAETTPEHSIAAQAPAALRAVLQSQQDLVFAVLVGSRATGKAHTDSDWDISLQWTPGLDLWTVLAHTETLRRTIARALQIQEAAVDLIDLRRANLAMRASVAEEGLPLSGEHTLAWAQFLTRTWRELEDFYWEQKHAA